LKDEPRWAQAIKTFIYLDSILFLTQEIDKKDFVLGSFIIASILDDIRYKVILLYEDMLSHQIDLDVDFNIEEIVEDAITIYYSYILGRPQTTISHAQLLVFAERVRGFITEYLNKFVSDQGPIRRYKEADAPHDNLLFIHKLKLNLPPENVDVIIGIRFGGIELPYLVKHFIYPRAKVQLVKISNYSSDNGDRELDLNMSELKGKNVLIVDDGITTGRTVQTVIDTLKDHSVNIFFASVYYSGYKRIKHMQMEDHGGINLEQLRKCCVLKETNYTASVNKTSYTNRAGKFDKVKAEVEAKAELGNTLFDLEIPFEEASEKDANAKKVFIACSLSYITASYDYLIFIRNKFQKHPEYEIVDDWLISRIERKGSDHVYREVPGRNYLADAIRDIQRAHTVVLFCPEASAYMSSLFQFSALQQKEVIIFYRKADDIKNFKAYSRAKFVPIKKIKTSFTI
jgi:orotate phosphoribosyltransferase